MEDKNNEQNENGNIEEKLAEAEKQRDEYLSGWQRCKADFLNYKSKEKDRIAEALGFGKMAWIIEMIKIYDNFERAISHFEEGQAQSEWGRGVLNIQKQFQKFLKEQDIEEIEALGKQFNPEFHEAVSQAEIEGEESGKIIEVLEKGYTLNGNVLRPSKVIIIK